MQEPVIKLLAFRIFRFRDSAAYERLYDEYMQPIRRAISRKVGKPEDVDELTAEVFLRAWEYMTANLVDNPRALLYKIAQNLVANFYRSSRQAVSLDEEAAGEIAAPGSLIKEIEVREEVQATLAAIATLKEEYREVLMLRFVEQRSIEEVADVIGKTANNVRVLLFRAKRALMKKL